MILILKSIYLWTRSKAYIIRVSKRIRIYIGTGKIYDMHQYTHFCTPQDLELKLEQLLLRFKQTPALVINQFDSYDKFYKDYINEVNLIESRLYGLQAFIVVLLVNLKANTQELNHSEIDEIIDNEICKKLDFEHDMHSLPEMINRFNIIESDHAHIDTEIIMQIMKASRQICCSAVSIVVNIAMKVFDYLELAMEDIKASPKNTENNMELMKFAAYLAKLFDAMFAASLDDPSDIFYQNEPTDDIK